MLDPLISRGEDLMRDLATFIGYHVLDTKDWPVTLIEIHEWMKEAIERIK